MAALPLPAMAAAAGAGVAGAVEQVFRAGSCSRAARIVSLTVRDLRYASKADNIDGLIGLATFENRVEPRVSYELWERFNKVPSGDILLLRCLQSAACNPVACGDIARSAICTHRSCCVARISTSPR